MNQLNLREFLRETDCYIFLIAKVYQKAYKILQSKLRTFGLTNVQHLVLEALWLAPGLTSMELSRILNIDKATVSGIVERLYRGNWIEKKADPNDKRVIRIFPTEKSMDIQKKLIEIRKQANEELLKNFSLEEKLLFKKFLLEILETKGG
ncbi:hypothetical protein JCM13304A_22090 [Desulfothermus okinawensis JCM 13304]